MINLKGYNIVSVHQENRSKILQTFFLHAPISRIEIAKLTSLTPPTISSNVAALMEAGLVKEYVEKKAKTRAANSVTNAAPNSGAASGTANSATSGASLGRKPILLDIVNNAAYALGVDWGPNGIICSITDLRGNVLDTARTANTKWEIESTVSQTVTMIKQLIRKNRINREKIIGIGVGVPGFVEIETGVVRYSPVHGWRDASVGKTLEEQTGLPVCVENNVRMMAVGEMLFSGWRTRASGITGNFLYVYVGEGMACAIVYNNELLRGNIFGAGELGHTVVSWDGPECRCGKRGCLEAVASEYGIKKQAAKALADTAPAKNSAASGPDILKKEVRNPNSPTIAEILISWDKGDKTARAILDEGVKYLGGSIANVINLINPRLVLIDGQIFTRQGLRNQLLEILKDRIFALTDLEIECEFKDYDIKRSSVGSAACAIRHFLIK